MRFNPDMLAQARAHVVSKGFLASELTRAWLHHDRPLKILFSDRDGWVDLLARKFRLTRHHAEFADIQHADLERYDVVVPLSMEDVRYLSRSPPGLHSLIPIPAPEAVELCDDKLAFHRHMAGAGFAAWLPRIDATLVPPYILKRNPDEAGQHCHIVTSDADAQALPPECAGPDYLRQEFLPGRREYASHVLAIGGRIVYMLTIAYGYRTDYPIKGRIEPAFMLICRSPWRSLFEDMLKSIGFEGLCCVNYKMRNGQPAVLEINPRLGRSATGYFFAFVNHLAKP